MRRTLHEICSHTEQSRILNRAQNSALYTDPHLRSSPLQGEGKKEMRLVRLLVATALIAVVSIAHAAQTGNLKLDVLGEDGAGAKNAAHVIAANGKEAGQVIAGSSIALPPGEYKVVLPIVGGQIVNPWFFIIHVHFQVSIARAKFDVPGFLRLQRLECAPNLEYCRDHFLILHSHRPKYGNPGANTRRQVDGHSY